ncbi:SgrR family transcriptional regulator [Vibrio spartinae]|uniref:HTH-type transcriptional regulator SgrR n=1 Tax=Vibrio spartinae TaxID=1918945 RepID=A0A1N6MBJ3_9VIBR|nr:SgrR family transcriptional regulator [Vibrio spartinae]SIO96784.1 HTH-type transcriptional regulator SgrR [Vibrio spartinae]
MNISRQILYFSRLARLGVNTAIFTTLPEVAEHLFTSPRHCRTLLKQMRDSGWIEWEPKVGRNQRSRLYLIYSLTELKAMLAQTLISIGKYEKALDLIDHDQMLFAQLLRCTSGTQIRQGRLHVQLTYDRIFLPLLPHTALRNSERFLLRQVYSCLTHCTESGDIQPELAHHWTSDESKLNWKFFLRPLLRFHDGSDITANEVVTLFRQLRDFPLYTKELAHVESVSEVNELCIAFTLSKPDADFAGLLSGLKYSIQPSSQLLGTHSVIGSGIFQVVEHSKQRITLQAYREYHGLRALTDTVTIWQLPAQSSHVDDEISPQVGTTNQFNSLYIDSLFVDGFNPQSTSESSDKDQKNGIEEGCLLAIINNKTRFSLSQRAYLSELIHTDKVLKQIGGLKSRVKGVPAYNLFPGWLKIIPTAIPPQPLPDTLTIAIFEHHALKECAEAITALFSQVGIHCIVNIYSFDAFYAKANSQALNEDIILTSLSLDDNLPVSAFCWMLSDPVLQQSMSKSNREWLDNMLYDVRSRLPASSYMQELEPISSAMITSHYLIPMLHHLQTLRFEGVLKDVDINVWGWPEIRDVWADE